MSDSRRRLGEAEDASSTYKRQKYADSPITSLPPTPRTPPCFSMLASHSCTSSRCPARHLTYRQAISDYMSHEPPPQPPAPGDGLTPHFGPTLFETPALSSPHPPSSSARWTAVLPLPVTRQLRAAYMSQASALQLLAPTTVTVLLDNGAHATSPSTAMFGSAITSGALHDVQRTVDAVIAAVEAAIATAAADMRTSAPAVTTLPLSHNAAASTTDDGRSSTSSSPAYNFAPSFTAAAASQYAAQSPHSSNRSSSSHSACSHPSPLSLSSPLPASSDASSAVGSSSSSCYYFSLCRQPSCSLSHCYASLLAAHIAPGQLGQFTDSRSLPTSSLSFQPILDSAEHLFGSAIVAEQARCRYLLCLPLPCLADAVLRLLGPGGAVKEHLWQLTHISWTRLGELDGLDRTDAVQSRKWLNWWIAGDYLTLDAFLECVLYLLDMSVWSKLTRPDLDRLSAHIRSYDTRDDRRSNDGDSHCLRKRGHETPLLRFTPVRRPQPPRGIDWRPRRADTAPTIPRRKDHSILVSPASSTTPSASASIVPSAVRRVDETASSRPSSVVVDAVEPTTLFFVNTDEPNSDSSDSRSSIATPTSPPTAPAPPTTTTPSIAPAVLAVLQSMRSTGQHLSYSSDLDVPDYSKVRVPFIRVYNRQVFAAWPVPATLRDEMAYMWDESMVLNSAIEAKWAVNVYLPKRKDGAEADEWCNVSVRLKRAEGELDDGDRAQPHALDEALVAVMQRAKRVEEVVAAARRPAAVIATAAAATAATATSTPQRGGTSAGSVVTPSSPASVVGHCKARASAGRVAVKERVTKSARRSEVDKLADHLRAGRRYHAPSPVAHSNSTE